jgi:NAD(P)-dependent dehydrogenase (short-subunit alcohol dehydrogenase family)
MEEIEGKVAFVTGGASGVGFGMAKTFLGAGMKVVIADIRDDHLERATRELANAGERLHALRLDVTDRVAFARAADEAESVFGNVHVVCNNAGINLFTDIADSTYDDWDWILGVNLGGVVNGVVTFVPRLKAHGEPAHVVNTASMAAFAARSGVAGVYTASKFAVRGLSEALRRSLEPHGIGVSVLCPALVNSRIHESGLTRPERLTRDATADSEPFLSRLGELHVSTGMPPEEVGEKVLRAIRRNDFYILTHPEVRESLQESCDAIMAAVLDEPVPPERLALLERMRAGRGAVDRD